MGQCQMVTYCNALSEILNMACISDRKMKHGEKERKERGREGRRVGVKYWPIVCDDDLLETLQKHFQFPHGQNLTAFHT